MRKLPNMVLIEETIGDGFINENGKKVVVTKTKTYARSKEWYEKNKSDETLKVLGDAYEKFTTFQGRKVRQIVTLPKGETLNEEAKEFIPAGHDSEFEEEIENSEEIIEAEKAIEPAKRGRKKAEQKEI